jgi:hypothetical protein
MRSITHGRTYRVWEVEGAVQLLLQCEVRYVYHAEDENYASCVEIDQVYSKDTRFTPGFSLMRYIPDSLISDWEMEILQETEDND